MHRVALANQPSPVRAVLRLVAWTGSAACLVMSLALEAGALTMVSNLDIFFDLGANGSSSVESGLGATSFTTDGSSYQLESVTLLLSGSGSPDVPVSLYSNAGTTPGSLIESLAAVSAPLSGFPGTLFTTPSAGTALAANTTYWIVVGPAAAGADARWSLTSFSTETSPGAWTLGDDLETSTDGGANWSTFSAGGLLSIQVVPEPALALLLGAGLLALRLRRGASAR